MVWHSATFALQLNIWWLIQAGQEAPTKKSNLVYRHFFCHGNNYQRWWGHLLIKGKPFKSLWTFSHKSSPIIFRAVIGDSEHAVNCNTLELLAVGAGPSLIMKALFLWSNVWPETFPQGLVKTCQSTSDVFFQPLPIWQFHSHFAVTFTDLEKTLI